MQHSGSKLAPFSPFLFRTNTVPCLPYLSTHHYHHHHHYHHYHNDACPRPAFAQTQKPAQETRRPPPELTPSSHAVATRERPPWIEVSAITGSYFSTQPYDLTEHSVAYGPLHFCSAAVNGYGYGYDYSSPSHGPYPNSTLPSLVVLDFEMHL